LDNKTQYAEGKAPRPILINLWYPTHSKASRNAMLYGDYLSIHADHPQLARFSSELAIYARAAIVNEVLHCWGQRREEALLTPAEQEAFQTLLETRTAARRDAPAARGPFPLIVYMAGSGSSFEDSSVLCEFLSSHGYVVIGSAFQKVDGSSLDLQGTISAAGDIRYLVSFAHGLPYVDWNHIGMIGHSRGAQAAIIYQSEPGCVVDATVSLDTTTDQRALADPGWAAARDPVIAGATNMTRPILFVASPNVGFALPDTLTSTPRYFLTIDGLYHDDFITHGSLDRWLKVRLASSTERDAAAAAANLVWDRYTTLCETVLRFIDAMLKDDPAALNAQIARDHERGFRGDQPHLEYTPPGADGPEPHSGSSESILSPRQVRQLLRTRGVEAAVTALREGWRPEPNVQDLRWRYPVYDSHFAYFVLYDLMAAGKTEDAKALYRCYKEIWRQAGRSEWYATHIPFLWGEDRASLEYLLAIEPDNQEAARKLKALDTTVNSARQ
jgi:dienelactone hydrolase